MNPLAKITFILDDLAVPSPGQQLLDRFLIGYNSGGQFRVPGCEVAVFTRAPGFLESRVRDFGLKVAANLADARTVVVPASKLRETLNQLPRGARCFVYGMLAPNAAAARELISQAEQRGILLSAGTATATAFRLPSIEFQEHALRKTLIVATTELDALETLRSIAGSRLAHAKIQTIIWREVWNTAYSTDWHPLLAAAVSRSNTIQGDPEKDGRTQDVTGLRLLEKLVAKPRAWLIDHADGLRTAIFALAGGLDDINFAVELSDHTIASAQLYRPPAPMQDHFSPLAEQIERFFRTDVPPFLDLIGLPALHEAMLSENR